MRPNLPPVTLNLLIIIAIGFVVQHYILPQYQIDPNIISLFYPDSPNFKPWQIVTHMFCHDGFYHILFNGLGLFMFGSHIERVIGGKKFLLLFFVSGLSAILLHFGFNAVELYQQGASISPYHSGLIDINLANAIYGPVIGASGAIYGIIVTFAMFFPNLELMFLIIPYPIKAKYLVPIIIGLDVILGIANVQGDHIAHWAHIGGAIGGFLLAKFVLRASFKRYN